jgi:hypothetical protein
MDTHDVPTTSALAKNRQWILDARPAGQLTGKEFRWHEGESARISDRAIQSPLMAHRRIRVKLTEFDRIE